MKSVKQIRQELDEIESILTKHQRLKCDIIIRDVHPHEGNCGYSGSKEQQILDIAQMALNEKKIEIEGILREEMFTIIAELGESK